MNVSKQKKSNKGLDLGRVGTGDSWFFIIGSVHYPCFHCPLNVESNHSKSQSCEHICPVMSLQNLIWLNKAKTLYRYLNILDLSLNFLLLLLLIDVWWGLRFLYLILLFWVFLCFKFFVRCNLYFRIIFFFNLLERFFLLLPFLTLGICPDLE